LDFGLMGKQTTGRTKPGRGHRAGVIPRIADFDRPLDFLDPVLKDLVEPD
jgi:hypothetical protein